MNLTLICVGKLKEEYLRAAIAEYSKRLSAYSCFRIIEVPDEAASERISEAEASQVKNREGIKILSKLSSLPKSYVISLVIDAAQMTSPDFADYIGRLLLSGHSSVCVIIGGSLGLSKDVLDASDFKLSFSKMTFPHQLARVIIMEQLYRAFKINKNEPYHK